MGEEGHVEVRLVINERGLVENATLKTSSGFARLDEAALAAARRAVFKPYLEDGKALKVIVTQPYNFNLDDG